MLKRISPLQVVAQPAKDIDWMANSVAFQKVVGDRLFFSARSSRGRWTLGSGKVSSGVLTDPKPLEFQGGFTLAESLTPNVLRIEDGFIMAFAGRRNKSDNRTLFVLHSSSIDGPWIPSDQTYAPRYSWEGRNIDLGPGNYIQDRTAYLFYSSAYPRFRSIAAALLGSPRIPTRSNLMRFEKRRIGLLRVDSRSLQIIGGSRDPLPLGTHRDTPFETAFCPGYLQMGNRHLLFVAGSNYSKGYPFEQAIGVAEGTLPPHEWDKPLPMNPVIGSGDFANTFRPDMAFDTPDPVFIDDRTLMLYFSAMSRSGGVWQILGCKLALA
jgi:hypothetical protein